MKSKHATEDFPWTANKDEEDLTCVVGDYTLRVEQMDVLQWWFQVRYKEDPISTQITTSKYRALGMAEGVYLGHSILNKNY